MLFLAFVNYNVILNRKGNWIFMLCSYINPTGRSYQKDSINVFYSTISNSE